MQQYPRLADADLHEKKVLLRAGFDVPMKDGVVTDPVRIEALLPTIKYILDAGASLIIAAHQGRPKDGPEEKFSQKPIVPVLSELLGKDVQFSASCIGEEAKKKVDALAPGDVLLLENLRFHPGEKKNDPAFAKELAALADVYVNDAFTNCHRDHASMTSVARLLPAYMGLQLEEEVAHLLPILHNPKQPLTLIICGAKMETKVPVIEQFIKSGDHILLGGAIANTFIAARGFDVGSSLYEKEALELAQELMLKAEAAGVQIHIPRDAVVATECIEETEVLDLPLEDIEGDMSIFDVGHVTAERYSEIIGQSATVVWNGPLGCSEVAPFAASTRRIAAAMQSATAVGITTIVGGGDTLSFHAKEGYSLDNYTFVSTGGGAMLDFLAGQSLPALEALVS